MSTDKMKRPILRLLAVLLLIPTATCAQDKLKAFISSDIVSHYMWRGQDLGNICIQPEIGLAWKGLSLSLSGSMGFRSEDYEELDIKLEYEHDCGLQLHLTDYWAEDGYDNRYLFLQHDANHMLEAGIGYGCKYGSLTWYTMIAGYDYKTNGDRAFSSFVELEIPFKAFTLDWDFKLGLCPYESSGAVFEETVTEHDQTYNISYTDYFYAKCFAVNMLSLRATKTFEFKKFELPVFTEIHVNPASQHARLLLGLTIDIL